MSILKSLEFVLNHPLNKHQRTGAFVRYVKWQIGSRILSGQGIVYPWINGSRFVASPGETGITGNIYCGLHEFSDMAYLLHAITSEDLFVDVGANVGSYTILACAAKGARGVCFEPVPSTFEKLLDNIRINDLSSKVVPINCGIAERQGELSFSADQNCTNHVVYDSKRSNSVSVKVQSLDTSLSGNAPAIIKIDVEGFESAVLAGAGETLRNESLHSVIMELNESGHRYGFKDEEIVRTMTNFGFSTYHYEPFSRELKSLNGKNASSGNTLFIRNVNDVQVRIKKAPRVLVGNTWL